MLRTRASTPTVRPRSGMTAWSRSSLLTLPTNRPAVVFMFGARTAFLISRAPMPAATRSNDAPYLSSWSRGKVLGVSLFMGAFPSCWVVHSCARCRQLAA